MPRYLDPSNDLTFKKVFGEHKDMCISLLNALLPLDEGRLVKQIEYQSNELRSSIGDIKDSIVDVQCMDNEGRQFIVETQMRWTPCSQQHMMFNAATAYIAQCDKKHVPYTLLNPM